MSSSLYQLSRGGSVDFNEGLLVRDSFSVAPAVAKHGPQRQSSVARGGISGGGAQGANVASKASEKNANLANAVKAYRMATVMIDNANVDANVDTADLLSPQTDAADDAIDAVVAKGALQHTQKRRKQSRTISTEPQNDEERAEWKAYVDKIAASRSVSYPAPLGLTTAALNGMSYGDYAALCPLRPLLYGTGGTLERGSSTRKRVYEELESEEAEEMEEDPLYLVDPDIIAVGHKDGGYSEYDELDNDILYHEDTAAEMTQQQQLDAEVAAIEEARVAREEQRRVAKAAAKEAFRASMAAQAATAAKEAAAKEAAVTEVNAPTKKKQQQQQQQQQQQKKQRAQHKKEGVYVDTTSILRLPQVEAAQLVGLTNYGLSIAWKMNVVGGARGRYPYGRIKVIDAALVRMIERADADLWDEKEFNTACAMLEERTHLQRPCVMRLANRNHIDFEAAGFATSQTDDLVPTEFVEQLSAEKRSSIDTAQFGAVYTAQYAKSPLVVFAADNAVSRLGRFLTEGSKQYNTTQ